MTWFDIYVLTSRRDRNTILLFISAYVKQSTLQEIIEGADLLLLPEGSKSFDDSEEAELIHMKVADLEDLIKLGTSNKNRCFWIYLDAERDEHKSAIIKFTSDGYLVLALSIEAFQDYEDGKSNYQEALLIKQNMVAEYDGELAIVTCYQTPPDNREEMLKMLLEADVSQWEVGE
ncbi:hypothetical protein ACVWYF_001969 [Hymenobacter sp. UYAg731]